MARRDELPYPYVVQIGAVGADIGTIWARVRRVVSKVGRAVVWISEGRPMLYAAPVSQMDDEWWGKREPWIVGVYDVSSSCQMLRDDIEHTTGVRCG